MDPLAFRISLLRIIAWLKEAFPSGCEQREGEWGISAGQVGAFGMVGNS